MITCNSPLETLAAFAIVFSAGVLITISLAKYIEKVKAEAARAAG